jgi:hypothetical protein
MEVHIDTVKLGVMNALGNKGAIVIRLLYHDFKICFINAHLPAHKSKIENRLLAANHIHNMAFV